MLLVAIEVTNSYMVRLGCFTPVRGRPFYLRSCLMQMSLQSRVPDLHVIVVNGPEPYDHRFIDDLRRPWMKFIRIRRKMNTREASLHAIEYLLKHDLDVFFKIDSDDLYATDYIASVIRLVDQHELGIRDAWCLNLRKQFWINSLPNGGASLGPASFRHGLGLSANEKAAGVEVGAPPTYSFNRRAAELILDGMKRSAYRKYRSDDLAMRRILADQGVTIDCFPTDKPVFGYVRHEGNTCTIPAADLLTQISIDSVSPSQQPVPFYEQVSDLLRTRLRTTDDFANVLRDEELAGQICTASALHVTYYGTNGLVEQWFSTTTPPRLMEEFDSTVTRASEVGSKQIYLTLINDSTWLSFNEFFHGILPRRLQWSLLEFEIKRMDVPQPFIGTPTVRL